MRAARFYAAGDIRVEEIGEPLCGEGQVKIRPAFVGICGSGACSPDSFFLSSEVLGGERERERETKFVLNIVNIVNEDLHEYQYGPFSCPPKDKPHAVTKETVPVTLGHEFSGTVVEVGSGVEGVQVE